MRGSDHMLGVCYHRRRRGINDTFAHIVGDSANLPHQVIREKEIADANRLILDFPDAGIQVLNGRFGPYITDKQRNAKIPKDRDPKSMTLEECQTLLATAPVRTFGRWGKKNAKGKYVLAKK